MPHESDHPRRRYCDQAATSWPKPTAVLDAWQDAAARLGATAGRGVYREAVEAGDIREAARRRFAALLNVDPTRVALPGSATLGLNIALHGLLAEGDHAIGTAADHNATLRPLAWLTARGRIRSTIVPCDATGLVDPDAIASAWKPRTRLVVLSHASNVTGRLQDVAAVAAVAHRHGGLVVLDAAQSAGVVPLDPARLGADLVVVPGHKWLLGPCGIACLWAREGVEPDPLIQGGTGSGSDHAAMPESFSERHEAGTPDVPAAAGFNAACNWWDAAGADGMAAAARLAEACRRGLAEHAGVRVWASAEGPPIVSFVVEHYDPAEVALLLEQAAGVQVRSGYHCAAGIHGHLGTPAGTVRASFGPFNTADDVEAIVDVVGRIASAGVC